VLIQRVYFAKSGMYTSRMWCLFPFECCATGSPPGKKGVTEQIYTAGSDRRGRIGDRENGKGIRWAGDVTRLHLPV